MKQKLTEQLGLAKLNDKVIEVSNKIDKTFI